MKYHDGTVARLCDIVKAPTPKGYRRAEIVMMGDTSEHANLPPSFVAWIQNEKLLSEDDVIIRWIEENPFSHSDPQYAPVGDTMFTPLDQFIIPDRKENGK